MRVCNLFKTFHSLYTLLKVKTSKILNGQILESLSFWHSGPSIRFHSDCKHQGPGRKHLTHLYKLIAKSLRRGFLYLWVGFRQMDRQGCSISTAVEVPILKCLVSSVMFYCCHLEILNFYFLTRAPTFSSALGPRNYVVIPANRK